MGTPRRDGFGDGFSHTGGGLSMAPNENTYGFCPCDCWRTDRSRYTRTTRCARFISNQVDNYLSTHHLTTPHQTDSPKMLAPLSLLPNSHPSSTQQSS